MTDTYITKTKYLNRSKLYRNQNNEIKEYPYVHKCTTKIIPKDTKDLKNNIRKSINQMTKKELLELSDHITKMMHKETFTHLLRNQHSLQETSDSLGLGLLSIDNDPLTPYPRSS